MLCCSIYHSPHDRVRNDPWYLVILGNGHQDLAIFLVFFSKAAKHMNTKCFPTSLKLK